MDEILYLGALTFQICIYRGRLFDTASQPCYNNSTERSVELGEGQEMSERKAAQEDHLLEIATRLFKEKGYHNTSIQNLADALGMQKTSLYYYIDDSTEKRSCAPRRWGKIG